MGVSRASPYTFQLGTLGVILAPKSLSGAKPHAIDPIPFLANQVSSQAEIKYGDISREVEIAFAQEHFEGGISRQIHSQTESAHDGADTLTQFRYSKNADTSWPGGFIYPGPLVASLGDKIADMPTMGLQRGSITYIAAGAKLYQLTTSGPTLDSTFAQTITALLIYQGYLVVGFGSSLTIRYRTGDTASSPTSGESTWTAGATGVTAQHLETNEQQLYRTVLPNSVYVAEDILGGWAQYRVAGTDQNITGLRVVGPALVVGKADGIYGFDTAFQARNLSPELRLQATAQVGAVMTFWNQDLYFTSRKGIVQFDPQGGKLTSLGLDTLADPGLPSECRPSAMGSDGRFLYTLVSRNSTVAGVYIWKLDARGAWHNYLWREDLGTETAPLLLISGALGSTARNVVVFAYKSTTWQIAYARWPSTYDPARDTDYTFDNSHGGVVRTLDYRSAFPTVPKFADRMKVVQDNAGGTGNTRKTTVTAYPDEITDTNPTRSLGEYLKSPQQEQTLQNPLRFHRLSLEFTLTGDSTEPIKFVAFHLSTALLTRVVRRHILQVLASSFTPHETGGQRASDDYRKRIESLRDLRTTRKVLDCVDEVGRKFVAYLDEISEWNAAERESPDSPPVTIVTVVLKEVVPL